MAGTTVKYKASQLRTLFGNAFDKLADTSYNYGGIDSPLCYKNKNAIVMTPLSDKGVIGNPELVSDFFQNNQSKIQDLVKDANTIIFPIAESRNILGIFKRNHWVTVHYDKATHTATLLDSRPRFTSILYPTSSMEKMIRNGLESVLGVRSDKKWKFKEVNQGVQYNDTHCGAWTAANVACLATGSTIKEQEKAFKRSDEQKIVSFNEGIEHWRNINGDNKTFLQKLKEFFSPNSNVDNKPKSSYSGPLGALGGVRVGGGINGVYLYQQSGSAKNDLTNVSPDTEKTNKKVVVEEKHVSISGGDDWTDISSEVGESPEGYEVYENPKNGPSM